MSKEAKISNKAWVLREGGKPIPAIALWQQLYYQYETEEKWNEAINTLIDISIAWKILGGLEKEPLYYDISLQTLEHIRDISEKHKIPLRKDWDYHAGEVQIAAGNYENALDSFEKYLKAASLTPEEEANIKTQIGFAKARLGNKEEGARLLSECIKTLSNPQNENIHLGKDVNVIWKLGAMMKLARVIDDRSEARKLAQGVLKEAQEKNLGARAKQAQALLEELK